MIDAGANLCHESFRHDYPALLERAWAAGLEHIVITGSSRDSNRAAAALAAADPARLSSTAGVHPHHASEWSEDDAACIRELAAVGQIVSLGECGLDYCRNFSPPADQRQAFAAQLALAVELKLPMFLHQRDASGDFLAMLREHRAQLAALCVHCFTDTREVLDDCLALDCHIGITGWVCDVKRGAALRTVVPGIPRERLLIESDAPYLLPHNLPKAELPRDRRRNEPALLVYVALALAELRGEEAADLGRYTTANARRFFGIAAAA